MADRLEIINWSFLSIGEQTITSLDDGSKNADLASELYPRVKELELSGNIWNFAKKIDVLSPISSEDLPKSEEFSTVFKLPSDCIRLVKIGNRFFETEDTSNFFINNKRIYSRKELDSLTIIYMSNDVNEQYFSPSFAKALSLALAQEFIYSLNNNENKLNRIQRDYAIYIKKAKRINGLSKPNTRRQDGYIINKRYRR